MSYCAKGEFTIQQLFSGRKKKDFFPFFTSFLFCFNDHKHPGKTFRGFQWGRRYRTMSQFPALTASFHASVLWMPEHVMLECHWASLTSRPEFLSGEGRSGASQVPVFMKRGTLHTGHTALSICFPRSVCVCENEKSVGQGGAHIQRAFCRVGWNVLWLYQSILAGDGNWCGNGIWG